MTEKELLKIIKNKLNINELVELFRYNIDECSILANPLAISERLLLIQQLGDFIFDGYRIVRNCDISAISTCDKNTNLKFTNEVFKKEKLFGNNCNIDIKSWESVFRNLCSASETVMVECAYEEAIDYYFGRITSVKGKFAEMLCFDGAGVLFNDKIRVNLDFVSAITFKDRYTVYMSKYINWNV